MLKEKNQERLNVKIKMIIFIIIFLSKNAQKGVSQIILRHPSVMQAVIAEPYSTALKY